MLGVFHWNCHEYLELRRWMGQAESLEGDNRSLYSRSRMFLDWAAEGFDGRRLGSAVGTLTVTGEDEGRHHRRRPSRRMPPPSRSEPGRPFSGWATVHSDETLDVERALDISQHDILNKSTLI